ncbi:MAG: WG repeat-containing protein [Candidatus Kapaibacterium sp.]
MIQLRSAQDVLSSTDSLSMEAASGITLHRLTSRRYFDYVAVPLLFVLLTCLPSTAQTRLDGVFDPVTRSFAPADSSYWVNTFVEERAYLYNNGYVGLIDSTGQIIVPPIYDMIYPFDSNGIANVTQNNHYGLIGIDGQILVEPIMTEFIGPFYDGYAIVRFSDSWEYGLVDIRGGVRNLGRASYVQFVGEGQFFIVRQQTLTMELLTPATNELVVIDAPQIGRMLVKNWLAEEYLLQSNGRSVPLMRFRNGLTQKVVEKEGRDKIGAIDRRGSMIVPAKFDWLDSFEDGLALALSDGKWGVVDTTGRVTVPTLYDSIARLGQGNFIATANGQFGVIDSFNRIHLPFDYTLISPVDTSSFITTINWGRQPATIVQSTMSFRNGHLVAQRGSKYGVITRENIVVLPFVYDSIRSAGDDRYIVSNASHFGVVNGRNEVLLPIRYDRIVPIAHNRFVVGQNSLTGVVSSADSLLIPIEYLAIYPLFDDLLIVHNGEGYRVIDLQGRDIFPELIYPFQSFHGVIRVNDSVGIASVGSGISLNTGIPRYQYVGTYFFFDRNGRIDTVNYHFSMVVEAVADWFDIKHTLHFGPGFFLPSTDEVDGVPGNSLLLPSAQADSVRTAQRLRRGYEIVSQCRERDSLPLLSEPFSQPLSHSACGRGVVNINGDTTVPSVYDRIDSANFGRELGIVNNLFVVTKDRKWGVVSITNDTIVEIGYDYAEVQAGVIILSNQTEYGPNQCLLDLRGRTLIPFLEGRSPLQLRQFIMSESGQLHAHETDEQGYETTFLVDRSGNHLSKQ